MALPDTYTVKAGSIPDYFEAKLNARPRKTLGFFTPAAMLDQVLQ